jgi:hypothetical protein
MAIHFSYYFKSRPSFIYKKIDPLGIMKNLHPTFYEKTPFAFYSAHKLPLPYLLLVCTGSYEKQAHSARFHIPL